MNITASSPMKDTDEPAQEAESLAERLKGREEFEDIVRYLDSLPTLDRLMLEMHYNHDLKYGEIAAITRQNINTVYTKMRRAKIKLRELLEDMHQKV